jgi:hypothetical protein
VGQDVVRFDVKPFLIGAAAGYLLYVLCPHTRLLPSRGLGGNLRGNAGGFTGGNPGVPQGPGFYGP